MTEMTAEAGSGRADQRSSRQDASSPAEGANARSERQQPAADRDKPAKAPDGTSDEASRQSGIRSAVRNHPILAIVCLGLVVLAIVAGILWYLHARHYESSDDAFIDARPVLVSPQVTGSIVDVAVTDNQVVKRGDLLAKIDPRDYQAAVDQADAHVRQAAATLQNLDAQISAQQAQIDRAEKQVAKPKPR